MKLLIYVPLLSPRIKYIFGFIFNEILKTEISFTISKEEFRQSNSPKFSYANGPAGDELFFKSSNLLLEHKITPQHIETATFGDTKVPFPVADSALPFDVFAASFYFLSRYEEYISPQRPQHETFSFENSLQYQLNLLQFPVIDAWALILKNILLKRFPGLIFSPKAFTFTPLYLRHASDKKNNLISGIFNVIRNFIGDKMNATEDKLQEIKQMIREMRPDDHLQSESVFVTDHHYEHHFSPEIALPKSYIKLTKNKIKNDYSIHYYNSPGFRAGTCTPFYWYDLQMEKDTRLRLHPVAVTDTTLLNNKTVDALLTQINELISMVKLVNGHFYFLSLRNDIRP